MADPYNVLLILPLHVSEVYLEAVSDLHEVLQQYEAISELNIPPFMQTDLYSVLPFSYKRLKGYKTRIVSLDRAEGLIAGDMIVPYPPGIPLIMRGEQITKRADSTMAFASEKAVHVFQGGRLYTTRR
ncbi:hypothetical protein GCM10020331_019290 [Ectobacillus funiculus]